MDNVHAAVAGVMGEKRGAQHLNQMRQRLIEQLRSSGTAEPQQRRGNWSAMADAATTLGAKRR